MLEKYSIRSFSVRKCVKKKDKNSINICGGCWSSPRWAAICRLISAGYIIERFFFLLPFLLSVSISWRKCDPEATKAKMGLCIFTSCTFSVNFGGCCRLFCFCSLICALESWPWVLRMWWFFSLNNFFLNE